MKKLDLGQTISIVANLGVIAGIVFLGIELQQNNALMESEARRNRSAFAEQVNMAIAMNGELASLLSRDLQGDDSFSDVEAIRLNQFWFAALVNFETGYLELATDELDTQAARWRVLFERNPALRDAWARNPHAFDPAFTDWVNERLAVQSE